MKLVILDSYTANPGDLSWEPLARIGELTLYDRSQPEEIIARIGDAEIVFTNKAVISAATMAACPNLKYIGVMATGYNIVDVQAARERGITVTNVPAYSSDSVAQHVFALLLEITNRVALYDQSIRDGDWQNSPDFTFFKTPILELAGRTLGIYGYGLIGRRVETIALALGMDVIVHRRSVPPFTTLHGTLHVDLDTLLRNSDVLTLHAPLSSENAGLINQETLATMKRGAILINTARGGLVVEEDLQQALASGQLGAAGIDVSVHEPIKADSPLLAAPNLFMTPHVAYASQASRARLIREVARNLEHYLEGEPINVIP